MGGIIEIAGESGAGKTQLCLQLLLRAQLPLAGGGLDGASLYIGTEGGAPLRRLSGLAAAMKADLGVSVGDDYASRVFIHTLATVGELVTLLDRVPVLARKTELRMIVIDSMAALFRGDFSSTSADLRSRASLLFQLSQKLRQLASDHGLVVVVVNQASDVMTDGDAAVYGAASDLDSAVYSAPDRGFLGPGLGTSKVTPALGFAWSNAVNTRLLLTLKGTVGPVRGVSASASIVSSSEVATAGVRELRVVFCPWAPCAMCHYVITGAGLQGLT